MQYGTVVFWGINAADEQAVLMSVVTPSKLEPLELSEIEIDEFTFHYSTIEPPHIQNDIITLNQSYAADHQVGSGPRCRFPALRVPMTSASCLMLPA